MRLRDSLNLLLALAVCAAGAQTVAGVAQPNTAPPASASVAGESWTSLSKNQQAALAPLEKSWNTLSDGHRRKWIALAANYHELGAPEREKLHSRMAEWAALSPKDRETARLNFAQYKSMPKSDRAANWEAYQALSPEEKAKLAKGGAKTKPVGAAVTIKPVAPEKLTPVPVTRHTPEQERAAAAHQLQNRNALLPQAPANTPAATAVVAPANAVAPAATLSQP